MLIKKIFLLFIIILFQLNMLGCTSFSNPAEECELEKFNLVIDPRVELFGTIKILSDYKTNSNNCSILNTVYKMNVIRNFESFKDDSVVSLYRTMIENSYNDSLFLNLVLHLSNPPELKIDKSLNDIHIPAKADPNDLNKFLVLMREFSTSSKFMSFFDSQKNLIEDFVKSQSNNIQKIPLSIQKVESFLGVKQNSYNLIITPLVLYEKYFYYFESNVSGKMDLYLIAGISEIRNGYPYFASDDEITAILNSTNALISFILPITAEYYTDLEKYSKLFIPIAEKMEKQNVFNWIDCFNEHIAKAVKIHLDNLNFIETEKEIKKANLLGFIYLEPIFKEIESYKLNRDKYKDFKSFYPRIISLLDKL